MTKVTSPSLAHQVEVSDDVAVTFHIEPNHNPKAGEPAQAWFVITSQGGKLIPLADCDCQLAVYKGSRSVSQTPVLKPALQAIAAEHYQGIPGADILFPEAGLYQLELTGQPKANQNFQPFTLSYAVTVRAGKPSVVAASPGVIAKTQSLQHGPPIVPESRPAPFFLRAKQIGLISLVGSLGLGLMVWGLRRKHQSNHLRG